MSAPPRVVSLVPSLTESVLSWGVVPVACTRFCEQPSLVTVGGTKDPDLAAIVGLEPDIVLFCEEENRRQDYDALVATGLRCHSVVIDSVADVVGALGSVAEALGVAFDPGSWSLADPVPPHGVKLFVPIWRRPWMSMSAGTYGASVLQWLGFTTLFADAPTRYPQVSWDEVVAAGPDWVVLPTEPYPFKQRHLDEWEGVAPARLVDGQDLFWWGTRTPAALQRLTTELAELLSAPC